MGRERERERDTRCGGVGRGSRVGGRVQLGMGSACTEAGEWLQRSTCRHTHIFVVPSFLSSFRPSFCCPILPSFFLSSFLPSFPFPLPSSHPSFLPSSIPLPSLIPLQICQVSHALLPLLFTRLCTHLHVCAPECPSFLFRPSLNPFPPSFLH